ncbi:hypothetical protein METH109765_01200 [Mesobacillus thioparans]
MAFGEQSSFSTKLFREESARLIGAKDNLLGELSQC